jgi:CelD/BcsL family acetyltransferase involved in cellulose biosynthesis
VGSLELRTLTGLDELAALQEEWDGLVRAMPRPSPWMLHGWLTEWWMHYGEDANLRVHVAHRDGRLVGALPLFVERRLGVRVVDFFGHFRAAPVDILAEPGDDETVRRLVERAVGGDHDLADFFGLHGASRLSAALGDRLRLVRRVESPVLDLTGGWDDVYRRHTDSKKRNLHKRRRKQLAQLGELQTVVLRTPEEIEGGIEEAFDLHALRWKGRPDGSGFATPVGRRFHRAAARRLAELDISRIVLLTLDGRPIAFHYYFAFCGRMFVHRLAFDPSLSRFSPGLVNTLDALEAAAAEGLTLVEYLGGGERYKLELSDRFDPLYEGFGLARSPQGHALLRGRLTVIGARRRLKRSTRLRKLYFDGLAPARRVTAALRRRGAR